MRNLELNYFILFISLFVINTKVCSYAQNKTDSLHTVLASIEHHKEVFHETWSLDLFVSDYEETLAKAHKVNELSKQVQDDTLRLRALLVIGILERELKNFDAADYYLKQCYALAYRMNDVVCMGEIFSAYGHIYRAKKEYDKSLDYHFNALKLFKKASHEEGIITAYKDLGGVFYWKSNYVKGIEYFKKALPFYERVGNQKRIGQISGNLGMSYLVLSDFINAVKYLNYTQKIYKKIDYKEGIAWMSTNLGHVYLQAGNTKEALKYYQEALNLYQMLDNHSGMMSVYSSIADVYLAIKDKNTAMKNYNFALAIGKENQKLEQISRIYFNIASNIYWTDKKADQTILYLELAEKNPSPITEAKIWSLKAEIYNLQGKFKQAKYFLEKGLNFHLMTQQKEQLQANYKTLSAIHENMGDHVAALENYKLFKAYQDSLKLDDAAKTLMKVEFDKKEADLKAEQESELRRKNTIASITYGTLGLVILFIGFGLYIFWIRNKKLQLEKQNLDLKRREAELAKDSEEFKVRFLSNISHEFRTPLTLINGHLEILKKEDNSKNQKRYMEMEHSGKRLLQLISQLLDLTKLEIGKYRLYYRKRSILNEIQSYIQAFHSLASERNIEFTTTISFAARTKFIQQDFAYSSEALAGIFNNLLSNALKFTPAGGSVYVSVDYLGGKLYLAVRDSGPGIPTEDLPYIFNRFFQVKQKEKPIFEGSGIGLAIVKELANQHGGNTEVINNPEGGCTFSVWLAEGTTIHDEQNEKQDVEPNPFCQEQVSVVKEDSDDNKPLILVVEDQRELRKFIVENLSEKYRYMEAENGIQGLEMAVKFVPDLIISDVMMPELDGFQLTKKLKSNAITSHIPIVLLTAMVQQTDKIEGLEYGADDYLTKPFSIAELQLRVKNRLRQQERLRTKFSGSLLPLKTENITELNALDRRFIDKLNDFVLKHIDGEIDVTLLANEIGLSTSQLTRKLKIMLGITPANFIKNIRMNVAFELLKEGYTVSETSWKSGFGEPAYFSKVFKKHFGFLPSEKENF